MKRAIIALSVALICAVSAPWGAQQAQAAGEVELSVTNSIKLDKNAYYGTTCDQVDVSTTWASIMLDSEVLYYGYSNFIGTGSANSPENRSAMQNSYETALANAGAGGSWAVIQQSQTASGGGYDRGIFVVWSENTPLNLYWSNPDTVVVGNDNAHVAWITYYNGNLGGSQDCRYMVNYLGNTSEAGNIAVTIRTPNTLGDPQLYFASYANVTYPEGYTGTLVPDSPPEGPSSFVPEWNVNVTAFRGEFSDSNFFTFDNTPFLCDGGLAPVINWEFYDSTDTLIDSGTNSATALFNYTFEAGTYTLRGIYDCGEGDSHTFSNYGEREFTITAQGGLESSDFYACLTDEFPFVDVPACLDNVFIFTQMLLFGKASFGSYFWDAPDDAGCGELAVLDNWIHVNNPYVCPMFPAGVRATITPFATFGLSLMLFRVVLGRIHNRGLD